MLKIGRAHLFAEVVLLVGFENIDWKDRMNYLGTESLY